MQEALFYEKVKDNLRCSLCPHRCIIKEGGLGICCVRKNVEGILYTLVYDNVLSYQIDPIEKKPLFHFYPGTKIFSFCTAGCNFRCEFCQNWQISQMSKHGEVLGESLSAKQKVDAALRNKTKSIAMTYNDPTIFFEYALDVCKEAKKKGIKTVFVSNGYIAKEAIETIAPYLDAINIDLKSFNNEFYKKICGARLEPVLDAIRCYHEKKVWVEITTLIIPGENDSDDELAQIAEFIASIDKDIPWHISRFHPDYKMTSRFPTSVERMEKAYDIGKMSGLNYIYTGNIIGGHQDTVCPKCKKILVKRSNYNISDINIKNGKCSFCNTRINGLFE